MKKRYLQILIIILILFSSLLLSYSKGYCYLKKLDSALPGQAGENNQFFSDILSGGVTDSQWLKIDDNLYLTPTKRLFYYNNAQGIFSHITDSSIQIGEKTYDSKGHLLRDYHRSKGKHGKILLINDYLGYIYDNKHRIIGYTLIKRDSNGNITAIYEYKGFTYLPDGKISGYYYIKRGARGNFIIKYTYSNRKHLKNGKLKSYERKDENEANAVLRHHFYNYDENNQLIKYTYKTYTKGQTYSYESSKRAYGIDGEVKSYDWNKKDQNGKIISSGKWKKKEPE